MLSNWTKLPLLRKLLVVLCLAVVCFSAFKVYRHWFPGPPKPIPPPLAGTPLVTIKGSVTPNTPLLVWFWYSSESDECSHYESGILSDASSGYFRDERWYYQLPDTSKGEYAFSFPIYFSLKNCGWRLWSAHLLYTKYKGDKYVDLSDMKILTIQPTSSYDDVGLYRETPLTIDCKDAGTGTLFHCESNDGRDLEVSEISLFPEEFKDERLVPLPEMSFKSLNPEFVINIEVGPAPKFCPETGQWSTLPCEKTLPKVETTF